ncbi:hypothetical protein FB107DRAFT_276810 [Schizophyllum commune]
MEESRAPGPPPTRSDNYYMVEGDVIVKVENTMFRFHAYHLQRSTTYFDDLLAMTPPPPLEDDDAGDCSISLDDVKASDFQALLWFYYESGFSWHVFLPVSRSDKRLIMCRFGTVTSTMNGTWKSVLALAEKFSMQEVAKVACYALHRAKAELGDVRKISLCVRYDLPKDWMGPQINEDATHHWECTAKVQRSPFLKPIYDAIPKPQKMRMEQAPDTRNPICGSAQGDLHFMVRFQSSTEA